MQENEEEGKGSFKATPRVAICINHQEALRAWVSPEQGDKCRVQEYEKLCGINDHLESATLSKLPNLSEPQSFHLEKGINYIYLINLL